LKFKKRDTNGELIVIVPNYREIPPGTVESILRQARVSWEDFQELI
jgi:predicted RNA binding protein YcfA (HicA-like mRNA interferase family)